MRVVLYQLPKIWIGALWKMICRALDRTIKWSSRWLGWVVVRWDVVGLEKFPYKKTSWDVGKLKWTKRNKHMLNLVDFFVSQLEKWWKCTVVLLWNFIWCEEIDELVLWILGLLVCRVNFLFDLFLLGTVVRLNVYAHICHTKIDLCW